MLQCCKDAWEFQWVSHNDGTSNSLVMFRYTEVGLLRIATWTERFPHIPRVKSRKLAVASWSLLLLKLLKQGRGIWFQHCYLRASAPCRRPQWSSAQSMDCRGFGIDQRRAKRPLAPQKSHLLDAKSHCQCVSDECFFRPLPLPNSLTLLSETQKKIQSILSQKSLAMGDCWPPKKSPSGR